MRAYDALPQTYNSEHEGIQWKGTKTYQTARPRHIDDVST